MKLVPVRRIFACVECPFCRDAPVHDYCGHEHAPSHLNIIIKDVHTIPKDCPLEDA